MQLVWSSSVEPAETAPFETVVPIGFGNEMRMVDGEGPAQPRRFQAVEVILGFLDIVSEITHLGVGRLLVHVLEQDVDAQFFGAFAESRKPFDGRIAPHREVAGEMKSAVDNHPFAAETLADFQMAEKVPVDAIAHMWRHFGDIDR